MSAPNLTSDEMTVLRWLNDNDTGERVITSSMIAHGTGLGQRGVLEALSGLHELGLVAGWDQ